MTIPRDNRDSSLAAALRLLTAAALLTTAAGCHRENPADTGPATKEQVNSIANAPIPAKLTAQEGRQYMAHMAVTARRNPTHADSIRAQAIVDSIAQAISTYKDVSRTCPGI